eukprot:gene23475-biopygen8868
MDTGDLENIEVKAPLKSGRQAKRMGLYNEKRWPLKNKPGAVLRSAVLRNSAALLKETSRGVSSFRSTRGMLIAHETNTQELRHTHPERYSSPPVTRTRTYTPSVWCGKRLAAAELPPPPAGAEQKEKNDQPVRTGTYGEPRGTPAHPRARQPVPGWKGSCGCRRNGAARCWSLHDAAARLLATSRRSGTAAGHFMTQRHGCWLLHDAAAPLLGGMELPWEGRDGAALGRAGRCCPGKGGPRLVRGTVLPWEGRDGAALGVLVCCRNHCRNHSRPCPRERRVCAAPPARTPARPPHGSRVSPGGWSSALASRPAACPHPPAPRCALAHGCDRLPVISPVIITVAWITPSQAGDTKRRRPKCRDCFKRCVRPPRPPPRSAPPRPRKQWSKSAKSMSSPLRPCRSRRRTSVGAAAAAWRRRRREQKRNKDEHTYAKVASVALLFAFKARGNAPCGTKMHVCTLNGAAGKVVRFEWRRRAHLGVPQGAAGAPPSAGSTVATRGTGASPRRPDAPRCSRSSTTVGAARTSREKRPCPRPARVRPRTFL